MELVEEKSSIARVYLVPGNGTITINKRSIDDYFGLETLKVVVKQPLVLTQTIDKYDVIVNVRMAVDILVKQVLSDMVSLGRFLRLIQTNIVHHLRRLVSLQEILV